MVQADFNCKICLIADILWLSHGDRHGMHREKEKFMDVKDIEGNKKEGELTTFRRGQEEVPKDVGRGEKEEELVTLEEEEVPKDVVTEETEELMTFRRGEERKSMAIQEGEDLYDIVEETCMSGEFIHPPVFN